MGTERIARIVTSLSRCLVHCIPAIVLLMGVQSAAAYSLSNPNATPETKALFRYFADEVYGKKCLLGACADGIHQGSHFGESYSTTGKYPAIVNFDLSNWSAGADWQSPARNRGVMTAAVIQGIAKDYANTRPILAVTWHWSFEGIGVMGSSKKVNVGNVLKAGTQENTDFYLDMAKAAEDLKVLQDAHIPVLFRPFHELDGGWFWWTDATTPANTAALWRLMYDYMVNQMQNGVKNPSLPALNNLIWVYSSGNQVPNPAFYPGSQYVDIVGSDPYARDFQDDREFFWERWNALTAIDGTKMLAMAECGAIPNPELMQDGTTPKWLYALTWFGVGTGSSQNTLVNDMHNWRHPFMITEDQLTAFSTMSPQPPANLLPEVGILTPWDDGSGRFVGSNPVIAAYATDRDGAIDRVEFYANGPAGKVLAGTVASAPYTFTWTGAPPGTYVMQAVAYDKAGVSAASQTVRIAYNVCDLALNAPVVSSDGPAADTASRAVDGSFWSTSAKSAAFDSAWRSRVTTSTKETVNDDASIYVDLGAPCTIGEVDLHWGGKIAATAYTIDVSQDSATPPTHWTTVATQANATILDEYPTKAFHRVLFGATPARFVRLHTTHRRENWGGYSLAALEIPAPLSATNHAPAVTAPASADKSPVLDYTADLHVIASDPDHDYLTYTWSKANGPGSVEFSPNAGVLARNTTVSFDSAGDYVLRVTVNDGRGGSAASDVTVTQTAIAGAVETDDLDNQGGDNGTMPVVPFSAWANPAFRFALQRSIEVRKATLRLYRDTQDKVPINASIWSGSTNDWDQVRGASGPTKPPHAVMLLTTIPVANGGEWMEFDVTKFVIAQTAKDGVATFVLKGDPGYNHVRTMEYSDAAFRPRLIIDAATLAAPGKAPSSGQPERPKP
jgi:mannan endo-1,4-beta-mannosidase